MIKVTSLEIREPEAYVIAVRGEADTRVFELELTRHQLEDFYYDIREIINQ